MIRNVLTILATAATLAIPSVAHAEDAAPPNAPTPAERPASPQIDMPGERLALRLAPAIFAPIGGLADVTQGGGGATAGLDVRVAPSVALTFRGGYFSSFEKESSVAGLSLRSSVDFAPFLGGIKWYLLTPSEGLFLGGEAGPVISIGSVRGGGAVGGVPVSLASSASGTNLGAAFSVGYQTGLWDLRAGLMSLDVGHANNSTGIMASAALAFAQF